MKICSRSANFGDIPSIFTHPSSTTYNNLSEQKRLESAITDGLIRISVGPENVDDIKKILTRLYREVFRNILLIIFAL